jgi:hypothetical protein
VRRLWLPGLRSLTREGGDLRTWVLIGGVLSLIMVACGGRGSGPTNFHCQSSTAAYTSRIMALDEVLRALDAHPIDAQLPEDTLQFDEYTFGQLEPPQVGFVLGFGYSATVDELVWIIVSEARLPGCSGPPEHEHVSRTRGGVRIYPYQFTSSVQYAAWFLTADGLVVEVSVSWLPGQQPPRSEQLAVVTRWVELMGSVGRAG